MQVTASHSRVTTGASITLTCTVIRTNPEVSTYTWMFSDTMLSETTNILNIPSIQDFGTYHCIATSTANIPGSGNVTIEQGCKFTCSKLSCEVNYICLPIQFHQQ